MARISFKNFDKGAFKVNGGIGAAGGFNVGAKSSITVSAGQGLAITQSSNGDITDSVVIVKPDSTGGTVSNNGNGYFRAGTSGAARFGFGAYDLGGANKFISFESANSFDFLFRANATDTLRLTATQNAVFGTGALATNATDGFLYIPASAGAPTGTPTAYTGRVPLHYDSTNNRLYIYNGAWRSVAVA